MNSFDVIVIFLNTLPILWCWKFPPKFMIKYYILYFNVIVFNDGPVVYKQIAKLLSGLTNFTQREA